jgi:hypothetical protein
MELCWFLELTFEGNVEVDNFIFEDVWHGLRIRDDTLHNRLIKLKTNLIDNWRERV